MNHLKWFNDSWSDKTNSSRWSRFRLGERQKLIMESFVVPLSISQCKHSDRNRILICLSIMFLFNICIHLHLWYYWDDLLELKKILWLIKNFHLLKRRWFFNIPIISNVWIKLKSCKWANFMKLNYETI